MTVNCVDAKLALPAHRGDGMLTRIARRPDLRIAAPLRHSHLPRHAAFSLIAALNLGNAAIVAEQNAFLIAVLRLLDQLHTGQVGTIPQQRLGNLAEVKDHELIGVEQQKHIGARIGTNATAQSHAGHAHRRPIGVMNLDGIETPDAARNRNHLLGDRAAHHAAPLTGRNSLAGTMRPTPRSGCLRTTPPPVSIALATSADIFEIDP